MSMHALSMDVTSVLCHHRLCHIHTKGMGITIKVVNGIPNFSSDTDLDGCDVCFTCKMIRTASGHNNTKRDSLNVK